MSFLFVAPPIEHFMKMKRKKNDKSFFNNSLVFTNMLSFLIILSSCSERYVHFPYYLNQADILFEDSNEGLYFITGTGTVFLCKYDFTENNHRKACYFYEEEKHYNFGLATSNSSYLFVYLTPSDIELSPMIKVFNKSFEEVNRIYFAKDDQVIGMECSEQYIYIYKWESKPKTYSLIRNDCLTDSNTTLIGNLKEITNYQDDDISLFFRENNKHKYFGKYDEKTKVINDYSNHLFTDRLFLKIYYDSIIVSNCGVERSFKKEHSFNYFYKKAFIFGDDLYFATFLYSRSSECGQEQDTFKKCFCGFKESYLFRYSILTNELFEINSFKAGTYLIDYDSSSAKYYYNGALYVDNELMKVCETIQADSLIKVSAFSSLNASNYKLDYYLSYYDGGFYGI